MFTSVSDEVREFLPIGSHVTEVEFSTDNIDKTRLYYRGSGDENIRECSEISDV